MCVCVCSANFACVFACLQRKGPNRDPKLWFLFINVWPNVVPCTTHTHTQYNNVDKKRPPPNTSPTQHKTDKTKFAFGCFSSLFPLHPYIFALLFSLGDVGNVWCFVCTHSPGVFQYKSYCCLRDKIMWLFTKAYSQHNWFSLPHTPIWKVRSRDARKKMWDKVCHSVSHKHNIYWLFCVKSFEMKKREARRVPHSLFKHDETSKYHTRRCQRAFYLECRKFGSVMLFFFCVYALLHAWKESGRKRKNYAHFMQSICEIM